MSFFGLKKIQIARSQQPGGVRWSSVAYQRAMDMQFTKIKKVSKKSFPKNIFSGDEKFSVDFF